ncbi:MAG: FliH/SctL family protein [Acidothermaceae bacterium]
MTSSSSSAPVRAAILRGTDADQVTIARMDADLRENPYAIGSFADRRLVDPVLAEVFEAAVASARDQARKDGFAQGYAEGLELAGREKSSVLDYEVTRVREAEAIRDQAMQRALEALDLAANALGERQAAALSGAEDLLLSAALDLATTLLGRELEIADSPVRDALRRALAVLPADVPITVSVHPLDIETLGDTVSASTRSVRIIADPDVEPGSCIADGGATHVDASLTAAIERVRQVLAP